MTQLTPVIYLAHLTDRVPIIPSFRWNMHPASPDAAVSEIFDLSQLSSSLNDMAIIEMHEVKGTTTEPERLKTVVYDGEKEQYKKDGSLRSVGDLIYAEMMEDDEVGCWSMHASKGEEVHESGRDLYLISRSSLMGNC